MADPPFVIVEALYPGLTQLDFTGPHTDLLAHPRAEVDRRFRAGGEIESDGGLIFAGTKRLAEIERCDLLFVPGGMAATDVDQRPRLHGGVRAAGGGARYLTSVCTGSLVLGAAGCSGQARRLPLGLARYAAAVRRDPGRGAGGARRRHHHRRRRHGGHRFRARRRRRAGAARRVAQAMQLGIEYAPAPPFNSGRPETAPPEVLAMVTGAQRPGARLAARGRDCRRGATLEQQPGTPSRPCGRGGEGRCERQHCRKHGGRDRGGAFHTIPSFDPALLDILSTPFHHRSGSIGARLKAAPIRTHPTSLSGIVGEGGRPRRG